MKIGLVLYTKKHSSSFIRAEILNSLLNTGELGILDFNESVRLAEATNFPVKHLAPIPKILKKLSVFQQSVNLWKYKDRTMSHTVRALNTFGSRKQRNEWFSVIEYENAGWGIFRKSIVKCFSHTPFHYLLTFCIKIIRNVLMRRKFQDLLKEFDIILIPFGGHISSEFGNIVWLCKSLKITVVALQENWDNLSSKTFIVDEPDHFAVWGRQSASHVRSIHRLMNCKIHEIGSPRFEAYFSDNSRLPIVSDPQKGEVQLTRPFILVAGTGDGLDDEILLESTLLAVANQPRESNVDVVYRPHPFTRRSNSISRLRVEHDNLIMDSNTNARELDHHIPLVKNAEFVVNHFSTMTLEALIAKNLVIVPLYLGREARYRYDRFLDEAQHYIGAGLISNLFTPSTESQFQELINSMLSQELVNTYRADVSWMCASSRYGVSLENLVKKITN